jgi:hypothetical protein
MTETSNIATWMRKVGHDTWPTGRETTAKTIGIVEVALCVATVAGDPIVTITDGLESISSAATALTF